MSIPTEITSDYWVRADAPSSPEEMEGRGGKWLIFSAPDLHDEVWRVIEEATESGTLGIGAKAATAKGNPLAKGSKMLLICVYTRDFQDIEDVRRVLTRLRELGFTERIYYKTNQDTRSRVYGRGASLYTAQVNSCDFTTRTQ